MYYIANGVGIAILMAAIVYTGSKKLWRSVLIGVLMAIVTVIIGYVIGSAV